MAYTYVWVLTTFAYAVETESTGKIPFANVVGGEEEGGREAGLGLRLGGDKKRGNSRYPEEGGVVVDIGRRRGHGGRNDSYK